VSVARTNRLLIFVHSHLSLCVFRLHSYTSHIFFSFIKLVTSLCMCGTVDGGTPLPSTSSERERRGHSLTLSFPCLQILLICLCDLGPPCDVMPSPTFLPFCERAREAISEFKSSGRGTSAKARHWKENALAVCESTPFVTLAFFFLVCVCVCV
jgi:hypothetical protein